MRHIWQFMKRQGTNTSFLCPSCGTTIVVTRTHSGRKPPHGKEAAGVSFNCEDQKFVQVTKVMER